jgi:hypothetical protein
MINSGVIISKPPTQKVILYLKEKPQQIVGADLKAEGEGFEPPETCASTVFKTAAFDHSAIPPIIKPIEDFQ